jgi:hypothetical protein
MSQNADTIRQGIDALNAFMRGEMSSEALAARFDPQIEMIWRDRQTYPDIPQHVRGLAEVIADGYRQGRYSPIAALVRTSFEDATLLAWMAEPEGSDEQAQRVTQVLIAFYRDARNKGHALPPDAEQLMKDTTGRASRKPPSMEDRVRQLDEYERASAGGKAFWASHLDHVEMLNGYVHSRLGGDTHFTDPMTRELLGFEALVCQAAALRRS